jgi:hypothetical protein
MSYSKEPLLRTIMNGADWINRFLNPSPRRTGDVSPGLQYLTPSPSPNREGSSVTRLDSTYLKFDHSKLNTTV